MGRPRMIGIGAIVVAMIVALGLAVPRSAEGRGLALAPGTWQSGIKIQNLGSGEANVVVAFIDAAGDEAGAWSPPDLIPVGGSVEVFLPNLSDSQLPQGQYSIIVYSDTTLGLVLTTTNYEYNMADSYNSHEPATQVNVPYVYRDHNDWNTEVFVQNTGDTTKTVYIDFAPSGLGSAYSTSVSVPASATRSFDVTGYSAMGDFIGTAVVTSEVPITVVANQTRLSGSPSNIRVLTQLRGLTDADAANHLVVPSLYKNFATGRMWRSGIQVQNQSTTTDATDVTIILTGDDDSPGGATQVYTKTLGTIGPLSAQEFYLPLGQLDDMTYLPDGFKGSATVESAGASVVAGVLHTAYDACAGGYCGVANSYVAPAFGTSHLSAPSLYSTFGGNQWNSGLKFQNISATDSCTCDISFRSDPDSPSGYPWTGTKTGISLDPGEAIEFYLPMGLLDGAASMPGNFKGSATVECTGAGTIAGTILHTSYNRGAATIYNAVNY